MRIADKTVLVTGANRGIGKALVEEALRRGAKRVYAGTRQPLSHSDRRVMPLTLDVTNAAHIQIAVERVEDLDSCDRGITRDGIYKQMPIRRRLRQIPGFEFTLGTEGLKRLHEALTREQQGLMAALAHFV